MYSRQETSYTFVYTSLLIFILMCKCFCIYINGHMYTYIYIYKLVCQYTHVHIYKYFNYCTHAHINYKINIIKASRFSTGSNQESVKVHLQYWFIFRTRTKISSLVLVRVYNRKVRPFSTSSCQESVYQYRVMQSSKV